MVWCACVVCARIVLTESVRVARCVLPDWSHHHFYAPTTTPSTLHTQGAADTSNFDAEFTSEPVVDSVASPSALTMGAKFDGFTFVDKSAFSAAADE